MKKSKKNYDFKLLAISLLTIGFLLQQVTIYNLQSSVNYLAYAYGASIAPKHINPKNLHFILTDNHVTSEPVSPYDSITQNTIFSNYRISYFVGPGGQGDATGFTGMGTAVAVSKRVLVTASHVIFDEIVDKYRLDLFSDSGVLTNRVKFHVAKNSPDLDLAIIIVDEDLPNFVEVEELNVFNKLKIGSCNYIVGGALGLSPYNITLGTISSKSCSYFPGLYQSSAIVSGGNSGGGVYNFKTNKLIGILVKGGGSVSLFVPITSVIMLLNS